MAAEREGTPNDVKSSTPVLTGTAGVGAIVGVCAYSLSQVEPRYAVAVATVWAICAMIAVVVLKRALETLASRIREAGSFKFEDRE